LGDARFDLDFEPPAHCCDTIASVSSSTAIFACSDIEATLAYYKEVLGFESSWTWGDPASFGGASLGGISLMFNLDPELAKKVRGHQHWLSVDDADELHRLHISKNARIVSEIEDKPWGVREYVVEDLNGYHLRIAGPLSPPPPSQEFPAGVTLERRKPASWEFATVVAAAFGSKDPSLLEDCWGGVVARSPEGVAIGVLRIVQDARGWFSIWDVAVLPDWQGRRIGSALMREALALIREASPGANVFLFTTKQAFYDRLGFRPEGVSMVRV
jgi:GNAT superfamily N-acetyltransferase/uncharacterized glyoxalase superfamily protein PhnB